MIAIEGMDGTVVATCVCLKLRMAARTTGILYDKALKPVGLTSSQFSALRNIYRFVPLGISELAEVMLLDRTTLTRNLELLRAQELLAFEASTSDGRIFMPVLTSRGVETLKSAAPRWRLAQSRFFSGLGTSGWSEVLTALRIAAAINEQAPHRLFVESPDVLAASADEDSGVDLLDTQRCANSTLRGAARYVTRQYDNALRETGLKATQMHVLAAIDENPNSRAIDLAARLSLDQASITLTISGMRKVGWVQSTKDRPAISGEPKTTGITLTKSGHAVFSKAMPVWQQVQSAKFYQGSRQSLLKWSAAIDNALIAALKAQIV